MKRYLFAKFLKSLSVEKLMEKVADAGLDGPTALIRNGYWLDENNLKTALPRYIKAAESAGREVKSACTSFSPSTLTKDDTPLKIMADNGIKYFRLGYMSRSNANDVRDISASCRALIEAMLKVTEKYPVKPLIQLHGNGPYPHSSTAAWPVVKNLPPDKIGIMIDPGNNVLQEGFEDIGYQCGLLREYIGACGVKDAIKICVGESPATGKQWKSRSMPVGDGFNDWGQVIANLKQIGFDGPLVFMPFYSTDDVDKHCSMLKKEVEFIDGIISKQEGKGG